MEQDRFACPGWWLVRLQVLEDRTVSKQLTRIYLPTAEDALARGRELFPLIPRHELAIDMPKEKKDD